MSFGIVRDRLLILSIEACKFIKILRERERLVGHSIGFDYLMLPFRQLKIYGST
ncbi:MAG: hypothetical protein JWQ71_1830 [Pedosphaera sp.]|nr:hypothetical protein [Pedosphaera sp.]